MTPGIPPGIPLGTAEQALRRLELTIVRRLDGLLHGAYQGFLPGPGTEFGDSRVYVPGEDDIRRMDWAVTARTTVPHVRDLIADRELETWALADLSPSMDFGTARLEKRDLVVAAIGAVGFLAARIGNRFGAYVLHDEYVHRMPARGGRPALHGLLHSLMAAPRSRAVADAPGLAEGIELLASARRRHGLRVIVSDFLDPAPTLDADVEPPWERPIRRLAARHQVLAVEVIDPRELELPPVGLVSLTDPETGRGREVRLTPKLRGAYAEAAAAQRAATRLALRRCGVAHLVLRTDRDWVFDIAQFVLRQRRTAHLVHRPSRAGATR
ncbi:uncharacterized protein (DUF58 family) [Streptosporangium becharense]|uniref:Uncharacterized protein (DUF58 family) n=1 Tax=Streptosporangium becharense TaxID=1816182 RepID=A0A7W9IBQ2_9ACTN|nr:DUF58 domain-containing protein [Streptosporangium becharense]MBB2913692.1 uncharacterized protein (DUF58 family) [Streptosporangium becharense]MBB5817773.1 uncharacterized protein (DUF58 family) [Streptosporangium becharense]